MNQQLRWHSFATADEVAKATYQHILTAAELAIEQHGIFKLVLAGGSTPEKAYRLLVNAKTDWSKWHIYFGDERSLPKDHADRNSIMASSAFLKAVAIPENQIYAMPTELGTEQSATAYRQIVANALPFDLVLSGIGEDGHTASLFPHHQHNDPNELVHTVYDSPKPPSERISLSHACLANTQKFVFIVTGTNKQQAVQDWKNQQNNLPVSQIYPKCGIDILIDQAAQQH